MKFNRQNNLILIFLLILLNLSLRIPTIPHEIGTDTYYIHYLANIMSIYGYPVWIEHPLQFFGFSSQPPSVPIIVSLLSQSSSISSEKVVLFISIATCVIGIFSFYAFVSFITNDDFIRFYSTFVFSTSPEFLRMTMWTITTRALFIALLPLFLYLLFKLKQEQSKKNFILFLSLLLFLFSVHHLGFFIFLIIFAFMATIVIKLLKISIYIHSYKLNLSIVWLLFFIFFILLLTSRFGPIENYPSLWVTYTSGQFFQGETFITIFMNMIIDYTSKMSIFLPVAVVGLFILLSKRERNIYENILLACILIFTPLLGVGVYTPVFLLPIASLLIAIGLSKAFLFEAIRNNSKLLVTIIIFVSLSFSFFMIYHWGYKSMNDESEYYMGQTKNIGSFLNQYGTNGTFTSNERGGSIYKYSVYSEMEPAPSSRYENRGNLKATLSDDWTSMAGGSLEEVISFTPIHTESSNNSTSTTDWKQKDTWYQFPALWASGLEEDTAQEMIEEYNINYVLETNFGGYSVEYVKNMLFFRDINSIQPKIYDNGEEELYSL